MALPTAGVCMLAGIWHHDRRLARRSLVTTRDLLIVRHAKSSWAEPAEPDFARRLNQRGVDDGRHMRDVLSAKLPIPDRVLCSPARRTRDTLAFLIPELVDPRLVDYDDTLYLADPGTWLSWIRATPASCRVLMLLGHNPGLTDLSNLLLAGSAPALDNLPTLGVAHHQSDADWGLWGEQAAPRVAVLKPKSWR